MDVIVIDGKAILVVCNDCFYRITDTFPRNVEKSYYMLKVFTIEEDPKRGSKHTQIFNL